VRRLGEFRERLERESRNQNGDEPLQQIAAQLESDVASALSDDLNAPRAVAMLFDFVRVVNRELDQHSTGARFALQALDRVMQVFEILPTRREVEASLASWVEERIAARAQARKSKDFKAADAIRAELVAKGVEIEDTPTGTKWKTR
jgi:cysteinyl-tRNA synthetase